LPLGWKGDGDGGEKRLEMYAELLLENEFDYTSLINTTRLERILKKYGAEDLPGGLAGADEEYMQLAVDSVQYIYEAIGDKVDIMAMGGAGVPEQAIRLARAGGSGIGINTGVATHLFRTITNVERAIERSIPEGQIYFDIVGADTARGPKSKQVKV
jgi:dihydroorotate dehydrogenase